MALLAYNKTILPIVLAAGTPLVTLPASSVAGTWGEATDVTVALWPNAVIDPARGVAGGVDGAGYVALQAQVTAGDVDFVWTGSAEYLTTGLTPEISGYIRLRWILGSQELPSTDIGSSGGSGIEGVSTSSFTNPEVSVGKTSRITISHDVGTVLPWPVSVKKILVRTRNNNVHCRFGSVSVVGVAVTTFVDVSLTHGPVTNLGNPTTFVVGRYLRGTVTGAVGRILRVVSGVVTHIAMQTASESFGVELVRETLTGLAADDTDTQATTVSVASTSLVADPMLYKSVDPRQEPQVLVNTDVSSNTHIAFRAEFGTAEVDLEPVSP